MHRPGTRVGVAQYSRSACVPLVCRAVPERRGGTETTPDIASLPASRRDWLLAAASTATLVPALATWPAGALPESLRNRELQENDLEACPSFGIQAYRDPEINRGVATEKGTRSAARLNGLLPPSRAGLQMEVDRALTFVNRCGNDLDKFQALMTLKETNRDCFYALLDQNLIAMLPIVYTPTVGEACQGWSSLIHRPACLYISIQDKLLKNWPEQEVKIAVITDGERILGLGDLGINGAGIPVGKAIVHSAAGGIDPRFILPIALDVGCNTADVRNDRLYLGLRRERVRGREYDELIDEVVGALRDRFGPALLVHWEDFAAQNAFRLLTKYQGQGVPTFNDDIQSTAGAIVAAVLGTLKFQGAVPLVRQRFLFLGAGQASIGGARLLQEALKAEGMSSEDARSRIWLFDSKGLVYTGRKEGRLTSEKVEFQRPASDGAVVPDGSSFAEAVRRIRPTAIIGAAARRGVFDTEVIRALVQGTEAEAGSAARPLVLALSNPDLVAECTAREAHEWSMGRVLFASGTAFAPFDIGGAQPYVPAQANNSLIFPGVGLGCIASGAIAVTQGMMLAGARAVAELLTNDEVSQGSILPRVDRLRKAALAVGAAVAAAAIESGNVSGSAAAMGSCLSAAAAGTQKHKLERAQKCIAELRFSPFLATEVGRA